MKKIVCLFMGLMLFLCVGACSANSSPLSAIKGANSEQIKSIQGVLDECEIEVDTCEPAEVEEQEDETAQAITDAMLTAYTPYRITDTNGNEYQMTLKNSDYSVFAIVDLKTNDFVYGELGNLFSDD